MPNLVFENVYAECKDKVWALVSRYVYPHSEREDLMQEVFLAVHKALEGFRGEAELSTWVYKIAVNTSLNYVKKKNRYQWVLNMFTNFASPGHEEVEMREDLADFKPLQQLNPQQRMILILADVEDRQIGEIAELLKMPVGTVKSNLSRSREIIKKEVMKIGQL